MENGGTADFSPFLSVVYPSESRGNEPENGGVCAAIFPSDGSIFVLIWLGFLYPMSNYLCVVVLWMKPEFNCHWEVGAKSFTV